jgi:uncharacterized protein YuzE
MRITYDPEADALYIELRTDVSSLDAIDVEEGVTANLDRDGHIIGLEILDASERLSKEELSFVSFENLASGVTTDMKAPRLFTAPKIGFRR